MMEYKYEDLIDDNLEDECEQIKSIAKKSWLNSAGISLANLDSVKATVYNVGLVDPKDLKATNLGDKKNKVVNDLPADPPLSSVSLQQSARRGSNSSIPDLIRQHSTDSPKRLARPTSATTRKTRPASGIKVRPQSAKEPLPPTNTNCRKPFGVIGARFDPGDRPSKGVPSSTTAGWVGPPTGLKYPDRPPSGLGWKLDFPKETNPVEKEQLAQLQDTPAPPPGSPEPVEQAEKTKRVFELFIGDPYKLAENIGSEIFEDSDSDFGPLSPVGPPPPPVLLRKPTPDKKPTQDKRLTPDKKLTPDSLRLSLPVADDDQSEDDVDTERLLEEANKVTKKLDLQSVFKLNKISDASDSHTAGHDIHHLHKTGFQTSDETTLQHTEADKNLNASSLWKSESLDGSAKDINDRKFFTQSPYCVLEDHDGEMLCDLKIEEEVSTLIGDDSDDLDSEQWDAYNVNQNRNDVRDVIEKKSSNEIKGIMHEHKHKIDLEPEHEKINVKFSEDKNVTVDITPRNLGRKVTELVPNKKKHSSDDSFIDLIEVKNKLEPILQAGKVSISPRNSPPTKRPPSGKSSTTISFHSQNAAATHKKQLHSSSVRPGSAKVNSKMVHSTMCSKINTTRPRSAPLNRAVSPVTAVTVDYGDENLDLGKDDMPKVEKKPRKKRNKNEEVVTLVQKLGLSDGETIKEFKDTNATESEKVLQGGGIGISNDNFARFDVNTGILTATVCKSEQEKNYYDIVRRPTTPIKDETKHDETNQVFKTTKTIAFDEIEPKEVSVKTLIDSVAISTKEKEKFLSSTPERRSRLASRPPVTNMTKKPPLPTESRSDSLERPGSRMGFVAMAPDISPPSEKKGTKKTSNRPTSAPMNRNHKPKSSSNSQLKDEQKDEQQKDGQNILTEKEKAEREKVIDNLLERTKTLLGEKEDDTTDVAVKKKAVRPASAYSGISRCKDHRRVRSATTRRPVSAKTTRSAKTPRRSSGKTRAVKPEPCIITTNTSYDYEETKEDQICQQMEKDLSEKGVNIKAETLQRALFPPSGRTKYYKLTADLPRSNSLTLLSHPRNWLPQEYKELRKAERTLSRANEIMYLQHKAEMRRARLAELGPEELKKLKKKGKKGGKKLRRSNSFG